MTNPFRLALFSLASTLISCTSSPSLRDTTMSTSPDIQTARWAVKWWKPRHEEKLKAKEDMGQVDLVFLGDSITHAWDNGGKKTWDQFYGKRKALNLGFSGDRTEHVLWRLEHGAVEGIDPKLLVLMIGTNNAGHREEPSKFTAIGIKAILDDLETRLPNTKILLLAIFPRGRDDKDKLRKLTMGTNEIIKTYADNERVHYLSINDLFLDKNRVLQKSVMKDLLHPNTDQYKVWAEAIEPKVKQLMGQ